MMLCNADATRPASVTAFLAAFDSESTDEGSQYGRPLFTVHLHVDYCMLQWLHAPHVAMRLTSKGVAGDFCLDALSEPLSDRDSSPGIHQERGGSFKAAGCMLLPEARADDDEPPDFVMATPEELEDPGFDLYKTVPQSLACRR